MTSRIRILTAAWGALLAVIIIAANAGAMPEFFEAVRQIPGGDKAGHFCLVGVLSLMLNLSLKGATWELVRLRVLRGSVILVTVATVEEMSQFFLANRTFSLVDLAFNYAGIWFFGLIASAVHRYQMRKCHEKGA